MRKKRTLIIGIVIVVLLIVSGIGYHLYTKPRQSAAGQTSAVTLSATSLYKQYLANEHIADQKYLGKIIEVNGSLASISHDNGLDVLSILTGNSAGAINCQMFTADKTLSVKVGDAVTIKGKCTGFLMDVNLVDCILNNK